MDIDLHAHLGASTPIHTLWEISREMGINIGTKDYFEFMENMRVPNSIAHTAYLSKFDLTQKIQSFPDAIEKSVYAAVGKAYTKYRLRAMELRFNPLLRNQKGMFDLDAIILHATIGMKKAMLAYPIKVGLIIETDRTFTPEHSIILAQKAVQHKNEGIVGFDMAGFTPDGFDMLAHKEAFKVAKDGGLGITVHAGEVHGKEELWKCLELNPDRIGHGIKCLEDKDLVEEIRHRGITLEVCPTSCVMTKVVRDKESMVNIVKDLMDNRLNVTLNTDGSEFLETSIKQEYELMKEYGLHQDYMDEMSRVAEEAMFIQAP